MIQFKSNLVCLTFSVLSCLITLQPAQAESLINDWNYTSDSDADSIRRLPNGNYTVGGTIYEIYGTGIKEDADHIWVGINTNLPSEGFTGPFYGDFSGNVGHGDLFFDFSGLGSFKAASDSASLFAVRFAEENDSGASEIGVYNSVKAKSVVVENNGWSNLYNHNLGGVEPLTDNSNSATMGNLDWDNSYYDPYTKQGDLTIPETLIPNVIDSGNKIGDITLLDEDELISAGFDSSNFLASGNKLFGFKFDKSLLPSGDFIASLILECNNDATAMAGLFLPPPPPQPDPKPVPEPGTNTAIIAMSLFGFGWQLKRRKKADKASVIS